MKLNVKELTADDFNVYGTFFNPFDGHSQDVISFIPDQLMQYLGSPSLVGVSPIRLRYRPLRIDVTEYHDNCEEVFGGFNCETIFHVGLLGADGKPDLESFSVFRLPKGHFARVKRLVLHHAGFVLSDSDTADGIVLLPPATYTIDCHVREINPPIDIDI